jgi:hypothetical protein
MIALTYDSQLGVPDVTDREELVQFTLTFSGNYPPGGDTLSFANTNKIQSRRPPVRVEVYEEPIAPQISVGDNFVFAKGTTQANGLLQINTASGVPFATGAYGATFATTTVKCRAWFPLGQ